MWTCPKCQQGVESNFGTCWECGTTADSTTIRGFVRSDKIDPNLFRNRRPYPRSRICPECGSSGYRKVQAKPWIWTGLWKDRICTDCLIRFTPPVPAWAIFTYLISGLVLLVMVSALVAVRLIPGWDPNWVRDICPPFAFIACQVFCLMLLMRSS